MKRLSIITFGLLMLVLAACQTTQPTAVPTRSTSTGPRIIDISASVPERGGFQPDSIEAKEGETITLRFTAKDTRHGVAIGPALGIDLGTLEPGQVKEVTLTFDKAGKYTFYCNNFCSLKHWRMRGVVDVRNTAGQPVPAPHDPVIDALVANGINIDEEHTPADPHSPDLDFAMLPSPDRGIQLISTLALPPDLMSDVNRRMYTPAEALKLIQTANPRLTKQEAADVVAYLWAGSTPKDQLTSAENLYQKNCASCHGVTGSGDGPVSALTAKKPIPFTDTVHMFTMRNDVLYAKLRRGGMGTDMPNFGSVFTPEESWALVNYLRTLSVEPPNK